MLFWTFLFSSPSAIPLGILVVRGDCDLETCRMYIDRLQEVSFFSQLFMLLSFPFWSVITSHLYLLLKWGIWGGMEKWWPYLSHLWSIHGVFSPPTPTAVSPPRVVEMGEGWWVNDNTVLLQCAPWVLLGSLCLARRLTCVFWTLQNFQGHDK